MSKYYDLKKTRARGAFVTIINGIMDDGKTFAMKEEMLENFIKYGERSLYVFTSESALKEETGKFSIANQIINPRWENVEIKGTKIYYRFSNKTIKLMGYFASLSSVNKVSRDELVKHIYLDEYNYGGKLIMNKLAYNWHVLTSRLMRVKDITLCGNATSLNNPILTMYKIYKLDGEWTDIYDKQGNLEITLHNWTRPERELDEKYSDNRMYNLMKRTSFFKHSFENEYLTDDWSGVVPMEIALKAKEQDIETVYYTKSGVFLKCMILKDNLLYMYAIDKEKAEDYKGIALTKKLISNEVSHIKSINEFILNKIQDGECFYETLQVKGALFETLL